MDAIERSERIRMATQAREAIAQNEARNLPVPPRWREWAQVDQGLRPTSTSGDSTLSPAPPDTS